MTTSRGERCQIFFNDAGAAHSGNHWTWIVGRRGLIRKVLAEGYCSPAVRFGENQLPAGSDSKGDYVLFHESRNAAGDNVKTYLSR